jgi:hypothetical protein
MKVKKMRIIRKEKRKDFKDKNEGDNKLYELLLM